MTSQDAAKKQLSTAEHWRRAYAVAHLALGSSSEPPERIYHYTTAEGLLGIVQTEQIWTSHVSAVNDLVEFNYGLAWFRDLCNERKQLLTPRATNFVDLALTMSEGFSAATDVFLGCFCEKSDLLSQWRGYGGSSAFCLEFAIAKRPRLSSSWLEPEFCSVIYEPVDQERMLTNILEAFIEACLQDSPERDQTGEALALGSQICASIAARYKVQAFQEEKEWRHVSYSSSLARDPRVQFRTRSGQLVPFIARHFDELGLALTGVVCGPTRYPASTSASVEMLLRNYGAGTIPVTSSRIPLRS